MLESVDDEALEGARVQKFVVVNVELVQRVNALDLAEKDIRSKSSHTRGMRVSGLKLFGELLERLHSHNIVHA